MTRQSTKKNVVEAITTVKKKNVVFFHPDLGIGGAERLVVDAAVGLQSLGHKVTVFTCHCDPSHCFDEARDGTLDVRVRGDSLTPPHVFGRLKILCSILRQLHLLLAITRSGELAKLEPSVFFLDQLSAGIPLLRWFWDDTKTLFYCHFPDLLLVKGRQKWYKRIWRALFDWWEEWGIRGADRVVANSYFTKTVVQDTFKGLGGKEGVGILYPAVNTKNAALLGKSDEQELWGGKKVLLSINRFEKKKNVALAIEAFGGLTVKQRAEVRLVVAGGYDSREAENVSYHKELEELADSLGLKAATAKNVVSAQAIPEDIEVLFLLSVPDQFKATLLKTAKLLIYTPSDEHFGIVPLEAMLAGTPVLAANTGGPLETVVDGETGWLRAPGKLQDWTDVLRMVLKPSNEPFLVKMGEAGRQRVQQDFSETTLAKRLDEELDATIKAERQQMAEIGDVATAIALYLFLLTIVGFVIREAVRAVQAGVELTLQDIGTGVGLVALALAAMGVITWKLRQNESAFR